MVSQVCELYLWLPISNILSALLGTIHEEMVKLDPSPKLPNTAKPSLQKQI